MKGVGIVLAWFKDKFKDVVSSVDGGESERPLVDDWVTYVIFFRYKLVQITEGAAFKSYKHSGNNSILSGMTIVF